MDQEVFDLARMLTAGGERGPYILVGQSLGGMIARIFADRYPQEVAGLVLVDAFSEDARLFMNGQLVRVRETAKAGAIPAPRDSITAADRPGADEKASIKDFMDKFVGQPKIEPPFDKLPLAAQRYRLWALAQPAHYAAGDDYMAEIAARIYAQTNAAHHPLRDLPLIVLQRTIDEYPPDQAAMLSKEHREQQQHLAALSSKGQLISVPNSGHHIQIDQPAAVADAIRTAASGSGH
jgi:pimeloyl-ACP methyl ester carboxylesterase